MYQRDYAQCCNVAASQHRNLATPPYANQPFRTRIRTRYQTRSIIPKFLVSHLIIPPQGSSTSKHNMAYLLCGAAAQFYLRTVNRLGTYASQFSNSQNFKILQVLSSTAAYVVFHTPTNTRPLCPILIPINHQTRTSSFLNFHCLLSSTKPCHRV
jgi:hypothetical protein